MMLPVKDSAVVLRVKGELKLLKPDISCERLAESLLTCLLCMLQLKQACNRAYVCISAKETCLANMTALTMSIAQTEATTCHMHSTAQHSTKLTCDDDTHSLGIILGPPSTTKHLHDV